MKRLPVNLSLVIVALLAQSQDVTVERKNEAVGHSADIFFWLMMIVAVAVAVGLIGFLIYRRLKREVEEPNPSLDAAFSLSEMRRLYEAGEISHDEYSTIRSRLLGPAKAAMLGDSSELPAETEVVVEEISNPKPGPTPAASTELHEPSPGSENPSPDEEEDTGKSATNVESGDPALDDIGDDSATDHPTEGNEERREE